MLENKRATMFWDIWLPFGMDGKVFVHALMAIEQVIVTPHGGSGL